MSTARTDALSSNPILFPDIVTLSGYHDINDKIAILGSVIFTHWSVFEYSTLNNVMANAGGGPVVVNSSTYQGYEDAWRFALGGNYKFNDQWMLTAGVGYDQTPTVIEHRDIRLPDADRYAVSIGGHYQYTPALGVDLGYTYLFGSKDSVVDNTIALGTTSSYNVNARGKPRAHLVGDQLVWTMDKEQAPTK